MQLRPLAFTLGFVISAITAQPASANSLDLPFSRLKQIDNICLFKPESPLAMLEESASRAESLNKFPHMAVAALVYQGEPQLALDFLNGLPDFQSGTYEQSVMRWKVISSVAVALAETGNSEQAMALLEAMQGTYFQNSVIFPTAFALAEAGQIDAALDAIALIDSEQLRGEAIANVIHTLALTGDSERALNLAATVNTDFYQVSALTCIAVAIAERQPQQARELFQQATQIAQRHLRQATDAEAILLNSESLGVVILGLTRVREFEQVSQVFDLLQVSGPQARCNGCIETLRLIRSSLSLGGILLARRSPLSYILEADGLDTTFDLIQEISKSESFSNDDVRSVIAFAHLKELSYQQVIDLLDHLEIYVNDLNGLNRGTLLAIAAVKLAEIQEFERALSTFETSVQTLQEAVQADEIEQVSDFYTFAVLGKDLDIAQAMIRADEYQAAIAFIRQYRSEARFPTTQAILTEYYALQLFQQGEYNRVFEIIQSFDTFNQTRLLRNLAEALVDVENINQAINIAEELQAMAQGIGAIAEISSIRNAESSVLSEIAVSFAITRRFETAMMFADQIEADYNRAITLREIATQLIEAGRYRQATAVIQQLNFNEHNEAIRWQNNLQLLLTEALATEGQFDDALNIAQAITDEESASLALKTIVAALASSGQYEQALAITEEMTDSVQILDALNSIAIALINASETERGLSVLDQILMIYHTIDL